jgi:hypothetical protein
MSLRFAHDDAAPLAPAERSRSIYEDDAEDESSWPAAVVARRPEQRQEFELPSSSKKRNFFAMVLVRLVAAPLLFVVSAAIAIHTRPSRCLQA